MAIKKVLLTKKLAGTIYDIFPKTDAGVVVYEGTTVAATLAQFAADLKAVYTKTDADAAIKKASNDLYNKIMGITDEDGAAVTEAYDTLKEVAKYLTEHGEVVEGFTTDIAALKKAVGDDSSGLVKGLADVVAAQAQDATNITALQTAVDALKASVGDASKGLVKTVADHTAEINTLKTTVGDAESGLVKRVTDLEAKKATSVTASDQNGYVKVDGADVKVYTHPATHAATMITEDDTHKFVTATEKAAIANAAAVKIITQQEEVINENDLYLLEIEE